MHMRMTTEILRGSPEYTVVNVRAGLFTLVLDGKWAGVAPESVVVAKLRSMVA